MIKLFLSISLLFSFLDLCAMKIDRVILASDDNPEYLQFWPLVAKAWEQLIGVKPTLFLIADESVEVDTTVGEVIRFLPIPGMKTSYQAQVIRIIAPAFFEDEISINSDIDTLPINRNYFIKSVSSVLDDCHAVYRNNYDKDGLRYPLCYHAVKGSVCREVFGLDYIDQSVVREKLIEWEAYGFGWQTDELVLTAALKKWNIKSGRVVLLNLGPGRHIDKIDWQYDKDKVVSKYVGAHLPRPFNRHKKRIMRLVKDLGINYTVETSF